MTSEIPQRFPLFSQPVAPLFATIRDDLDLATAVRPRVIRLFLDDANSFLAGGVDGDTYAGYLKLLYLLRTRLDAKWWVQWVTVDDAADVTVALTKEYAPILTSIPPDEAMLYKDEQDVIKQQRANPMLSNVRWGQAQSLY